MPASVAVWQLPSTEPVLKQQMECSLSLPLVPRVVTTPNVLAIPSVPKNTPVSQVSHAPSLATPPPPSVSVSWTQHRSLASPSPSQVVSFLPSSHWPQRYYYSATSGGRSYGRSYGRSFPKDRTPRAILWPVFCVNIKNYLSIEYQ